MWGGELENFGRGSRKPVRGMRERGLGHWRETSESGQETALQQTLTSVTAAHGRLYTLRRLLPPELKRSEQHPDLLLPLHSEEPPSPHSRVRAFPRVSPALITRGKGRGQRPRERGCDDREGDSAREKRLLALEATWREPHDAGSRVPHFSTGRVVAGISRRTNGHLKRCPVKGRVQWRSVHPLNSTGLYRMSFTSPSTTSSPARTRAVTPVFFRGYLARVMGGRYLLGSRRDLRSARCSALRTPPSMLALPNTAKKGINTGEHAGFFSVNDGNTRVSCRIAARMAATSAQMAGKMHAKRQGLQRKERETCAAALVGVRDELRVAVDGDGGRGRAVRRNGTLQPEHRCQNLVATADVSVEYRVANAKHHEVECRRVRYQRQLCVAVRLPLLPCKRARRLLLASACTPHERLGVGLGSRSSGGGREDERSEIPSESPIVNDAPSSLLLAPSSPSSSAPSVSATAASSLSVPAAGACNGAWRISCLRRLEVLGHLPFCSGTRARGQRPIYSIRLESNSKIGGHGYLGNRAQEA
eukprot:944607-Rhodomonas_salina.1